MATYIKDFQTSNFVYLVLITTLFVRVRSENNISCYHCVSVAGTGNLGDSGLPECANPFYPEQETVNIRNNCTACKKMRIRGNRMGKAIYETRRECLEVVTSVEELTNHCDGLTTHSIPALHCFCQTDLCNHGHTVTSLPPYTLLSTVVALISTHALLWSTC